MDILEEVTKIAREKSHDSNIWKTVLVISLVALGIWAVFKFLGKLAPRTNRQHMRDMYIPRYPSRRR